MKLCLYSGGDRNQNHEINQKLISMLPSKKAKIVYVPSAGDEERKYFKEFKAWYEFYGLKNLVFFNLEKGFDENSANEVLSSNAIYLSGGNTYYFLSWLKKRKFLSHLKDFVKDGGVLIGVSAGSILMTPNINISGIPSYDCDKNEVGIKNLKSLSLVNFEFFPHYSSSQRLDKELLQHSKMSTCPIFAMEEGSGIVIWDTETCVIGSHKIFYNGKSFTLYDNK